MIRFFSRLIISFLLVCHLSLYTVCFQYNPEIVVTIMIKNEEHVIIPTLQPFIDAGIKHYVVFDTGSTDQTVAIVKDFFDQNPTITGLIFQEPFVDFATSRNRALEYTRQQFPFGGFILMPDAEWYMQNVEKLIDFCHQELQKDEQPDCYLVRMIMGNIDFYQPRLIKIASQAHFEGEIHESIYTPHTACRDSFFVVQTTPQGFEKTKKRWERDLQILLKKYKKNPWDARTLFYLAQTYECLQDRLNAQKYYTLRTQVVGSKEEDFMAHYRAGQIAESLDDWDRALSHYLEAFNICSERIEPLVKISQYYWSNKNIPASYLFASYACKLPYPEENRLFIDKEIYDFTRWEMLGITAWHMKEFTEGKAAAQKAYEQRPHLEYLYRNVVCYQ